ncbi:MAG TPA: hypothetical protein VNT26_18110, partial [Candidatus Sulfotelmatobacter sp.]|nr:hypothetical protein [Candidatus Sulfotelmatobacter sp.]
MKDTPCTSARSFLQRTHGFIRPILGLGAGTAALLVALTASAGSFVADFNSGLPAGATIYGNATVDPTGGVTNSGCLKLTGAINTQQGSFVITNNLDEGTNIVALVARFQAYVGGGSGADGFSFNYAPDLPANGTFAEDGAGTGLTVSFDTYSNDFDVVGIELKGSGNPVAAWSTINLRAGTWVDVLIQMHPDGNVDVMYDGNWVFTNQWAGVPLPITGGRFGFGSRTGGANDNHWFDNLSITTIADTKAAAYVDYYYPTGRRVRADAPIYVELSDYFNYYTAINSQVNPSSIVLQVDGTTVSPTFTGAASKTAVRYQPPAIFASGSTHTVSLSFADNAMPTPNTTRQEWSFTVDSYKTLDTNLMAAPALVSANHGFALRVSQIDANRGPTIQRAENQLAGLLLDPTTGQPYLNRATLSATNEPCVINYSTAGAQGNFLTELPASIPGLPGALPDGTSAGDTNAALDAVTYLYLSPGIYTLGVNSSDGFRLTTASTPDLFAPQIAVYEGVRAAADSTVTFGIAQAGYYPFRICYFIGGQEVVYP